jgi:hypothetical protein
MMEQVGMGAPDPASHRFQGHRGDSLVPKKLARGGHGQGAAFLR